MSCSEQSLLFRIYRNRRKSVTKAKPIFVLSSRYEFYLLVPEGANHRVVKAFVNFEDNHNAITYRDFETYEMPYVTYWADQQTEKVTVDQRRLSFAIKRPRTTDNDDYVDLPPLKKLRPSFKIYAQYKQENGDSDKLYYRLLCDSDDETPRATGDEVFDTVALHVLRWVKQFLSKRDLDPNSWKLDSNRKVFFVEPGVVHVVTKHLRGSPVTATLMGINEEMARIIIEYMGNLKYVELKFSRALHM